MKTPYTHDELIAKIREKIDYSKVNQKKHSHAHMEHVKSVVNHVMTQDEFIAISKKKFGDKFDYSKVNYVDRRTDVILICPVHGEIVVNPMRHLHSQTGCPKCSGGRPMTFDEFITKAKEKFGDKFDYSKVNSI